MAENALLRRERLRRGLTQEQLAERAKLTARTIGRLEQGGRPRPDTIRLLTGYFKLPAEALGLSPRGRVESGPAPLALPAGAGSDMQRRDVLGLLTATGGTLLRPADGAGADSLLLADTWTPDQTAAVLASLDAGTPDSAAVKSQVGSPLAASNETTDSPAAACTPSGETTGGPTAASPVSTAQAFASDPTVAGVMAVSNALFA